MPRIYDYQEYQSKKNKAVTSEFTFSCEIGYLDVNITGKPPEISDVDELECEIEYRVGIDRNKKGISDLNFIINSIELELKVDDHPNDMIEFEFDVVPGENIDHSQVIVRKLENLIPCEPTKVSINMMKSMNPKDFKIEVFFGKDEK